MMLLHFINKEVLLLTLLVTISLSIGITFFSKDKRCQRILIVWIIVCAFLMLYTTVIGRPRQDAISIQLIPFWSIKAIQDGLIETFYEKIYNVLLFVPYGVLLTLYYGDTTIWKSVKIGFLTSVVIEVTQLVTRTGTCEIDDVICNTIGCFLAALLVQIVWFNGFKKCVKQNI